MLLEGPNNMEVLLYHRIWVAVVVIALFTTTTTTSCTTGSKRSNTACVANGGWSDVETATWIKKLIVELDDNIVVEKHTPHLCKAVLLAAVLVAYSSAENKFYNTYDKSPGSLYTGAERVASPEITVSCQLALLAYVGGDLTIEDLKQVVGNQPSRVFYTGVYNKDAAPCS